MSGQQQTKSGTDGYVHSVTISCRYIGEEMHLLILVPGTTDPFNSNEDSQVASNSTEVYWKMSEAFLEATGKSGEQYQCPLTNDAKPFDGQEFRRTLSKFDDDHLALLTNVDLEWNGNNMIRDRENAGKAIANMLLNDKSYANRKNKPMYIHLIGHSHGGNVINEFTRAINETADFPEQWKIKSVIYLSTPFFSDLHKIVVNTKVFWKDAKILNVYNKYDLTQRFIADFSLEDFSKAAAYMKTKIDEHLSEKWKEEDRAQELEKFSELVSDFELVSSGAGARVFAYRYDNMIALFQSLSGLFNHIADLIGALPEIINYIASKPINNEGKTVIPNDLANTLKNALGELKGEMRDNAEALLFQKEKINDRPNKPEYIPVTALFEKLTFNELFKFLNIDPETLKTKGELNLWSLLVKILTHNISAYDNTSNDPSKFFKGTMLKDGLEQLDVTDLDPYSKTPNEENFKKFMQKLEGLEDNFAKSYEVTKNKESAPEQIRAAQQEIESITLNMILTLIANMSAIKWIYIVPLTSWLVKLAHVVARTINGNNYIEDSAHTHIQISELANLLSDFKQIVDDRNDKLVTSWTDYIKNPVLEVGGDILNVTKEGAISAISLTNPITLCLNNYLNWKRLKTKKESERLEDAIRKRDPIVYFLIDSHSISRHIVFPEVLEFLKEVTQFDKHKYRTPRVPTSNIIKDWDMLFRLPF